MILFNIIHDIIIPRKKDNMINELKEISKNNINILSSEDIIKLINKPYLITDIAKEFNITVKEFNKIKKQKGISNILFEDTIRNIETILYYVDINNVYVSDNIRKEITNKLISIFTGSIAKLKNYANELKEYNFSRENIFNDMSKRNIDYEYRINNLSNTIPYINNEIKNLMEKEKDYLLNHNNSKLYNELKEKKQNGKILSKNDLTYDILFELVIIESISNSLIAVLFNMTVNEVKYLRKKNGLSNAHATRLKYYPETILYYAKRNNKDLSGMTWYQYKNEIDKEIIRLQTEKIKKNNNNDNKILTNNIDIGDKITTDIEGEQTTFNVIYSNDKFNSKTSDNNIKRKNNGSRRNQKQESETKIKHGKIGEQIAKLAEINRLKKLGLGHLTKDVNLVAQLDEDITFDGLGYDLISFNDKGEKIVVEVKTCFGKKDRPFFITHKELEVIQGIKKEHDITECIILYLLIDKNNVTIKSITNEEFNELKLKPFLYKIG